MRRKPLIVLIAPGALSPPLQEQRAIALWVREENSMHEERSA
jgi:hypothetical protein